jgi:serine phosphatase RsbU (regulator of sigma subunit)
VRWARGLRERFGVDMDSDVGLPSVLKTGEPYLLYDIDASWLRQVLGEVPGITEDEVKQFMALDLRSSMTVPLKNAKGKVLGAIGLVSAGTNGLYSDEDLTLATEIARRAAVAVENAQLFEHTRHTSRTLQKSLLPPALPDLSFVDLGVCFMPLGGEDDLLGGDFYDVIDLGKDTWAVILGDVSGKGIEAATLASATRWSFRSVITRTPDPADALRELNDALLTQEWGDRYVTAVAAVVRPDPSGQMSVRYSVGGHPRPVLRRSDGNAEHIVSGGTLIGALPSGTWETDEVLLDHGDIFVLYSDGLSEAINDAGAFFGEEGVLAVVAEADIDPTQGGRAEQLANDLCAAATAFGTQRDDMAALVLCCGGRDGNG